MFLFCVFVKMKKIVVSVSDKDLEKIQKDLKKLKSELEKMKKKKTNTVVLVIN